MINLDNNIAVDTKLEISPRGAKEFRQAVKRSGTPANSRKSI